MVHIPNDGSRILTLLCATCSLVAIGAKAAEGQVLRGPDLGVWFESQKGAGGTSVLIVAQLADDGVFVQAGLREGDQIVSINGRSIGSEFQFVQTLVLLGSGNQQVTLVVSRRNESHSLTFTGSALMQGMAAPDPLYQAGLIIDERNPKTIIVQRVFPCTPAFYAGLRQADVITAISGQPLTSLADLIRALRRGGNLNLLVTRNDQTRPLTLMMGSDRSTRSAVRSTVNQGTISRWTEIPGSFRRADGPQPPSISPLRSGPTSPPLLAPPVMPSMPPVVPSPPPVVPALPPPGAVPNVPRV